MYLLLLAALLFAVIFGPQWWARRTLEHYRQNRPDLPGTGGELARHLLRRHGLDHVVVEACEPGADHYDPGTRRVRLSPDHLDGSSLSAVAVAAHEVGHALQHANGDPGLAMRGRLVGIANAAARLGALLLLAMPLITLLTHLPGVGLLLAAIGLANLALPVVVHLLTLPVEWDASFNRALPLLREGRYLSASDLRRVRRILRAAALTYLASALASLLNLGRWWLLLRRG